MAKDERAVIDSLRLETLKQAVIEKYSSEIDFNQPIELYETIIHKLVDGELDYWFYSEELKDLDSFEKESVFTLARAYCDLCFYQGDPNLWLESVSGASLGDFDYTCAKILENYNFLLVLSHLGGESVLKEVQRIDTMHYLDGVAPIEFLRNRFINDEILIQFLCALSDPKGKAKELSYDEKAILCAYPDGVIYSVSDQGEIVLNDLNQLIEGYQKKSSEKQLLSFEEFVVNLAYQDMLSHKQEVYSFNNNAIK